MLCLFSNTKHYMLESKQAQGWGLWGLKPAKEFNHLVNLSGSVNLSAAKPMASKLLPSDQNVYSCFAANKFSLDAFYMGSGDACV